MPLTIHVIGAKGRVGSRVVALAKEDPRFMVTDSLQGATVGIDFSSPNALYDFLPRALNAHIPLVLGTTGYLEKEKALIQEASTQIAILLSPNFSLGMAVCMEAAVLLAKKFGGDLDIIELHRHGKKDKPSGTSLEMKAVLGNPDIPIHSVCAGDAMGTQTLMLSAEGESIELKHQVHSRDAFAKGALKAALFLKEKPPGLYSVKDLFS